uniref:Auxin-responsive protein n=1 Tax=Rhizophora mucronata TaxID=61149 RepID=A0A2P2QSG9_RHIMU
MDPLSLCSLTKIKKEIGCSLGTFHGGCSFAQ